MLNVSLSLDLPSKKLLLINIAAPLYSNKFKIEFIVKKSYLLSASTNHNAFLITELDLLIELSIAKDLDILLLVLELKYEALSNAKVVGVNAPLLAAVRTKYIIISVLNQKHSIVSVACASEECLHGDTILTDSIE